MSGSACLFRPLCSDTTGRTKRTARANRMQLSTPRHLHPASGTLLQRPCRRFPGLEFPTGLQTLQKRKNSKSDNGQTNAEHSQSGNPAGKPPVPAPGFRLCPHSLKGLCLAPFSGTVIVYRNRQYQTILTPKNRPENTGLTPFPIPGRKTGCLLLRPLSEKLLREFLPFPAILPVNCKPLA